MTNSKNNILYKMKGEKEKEEEKKDSNLEEKTITLINNQEKDNTYNKEELILTFYLKTETLILINKDIKNNNLIKVLEDNKDKIKEDKDKDNKDNNLIKVLEVNKDKN